MWVVCLAQSVAHNTFSTCNAYKIKAKVEQRL